MSNTGNVTTPAGWYPDPEGSTKARWWDGAAWTDQYQQPNPYAQPGQPAYAPQPTYAPVAPLRAPEGTSPYTLFVWALAGLPIISILSHIVYFASGALADDLTDVMGNVISGGELITYAVTVLVTILTIALGILDYRALKANGVPKPFHWAFIFFAVVGAPVYIIGRSIVVKRRTGSGYRPMILNLALLVFSFALETVLRLTLLIPVYGDLSNSVF